MHKEPGDIAFKKRDETKTKAIKLSWDDMMAYKLDCKISVDDEGTILRAVGSKLSYQDEEYSKAKSGTAHEE
jgi:hypothetical protein